MSDTDARLRAAVGGEPPAGIAALDEASRAALADLIEQARARQARTLAESFEATLRHVPFPARAIVKKVLLG